MFEQIVRISYLKTNSITLVIYDSLIEETNCRDTVVFQSCFSFSLTPPWLYKVLTTILPIAFQESTNTYYVRNTTYYQHQNKRLSREGPLLLRIQRKYNKSDIPNNFILLTFSNFSNENDENLPKYIISDYKLNQFC